MNTLHKTRGGSRIALIGAAMLFSLFTSQAQENTGSISGTVMDATGAAVPGVKIQLASPSVPGGLETLSDDGGNYAFARVPNATFVLTATKTGFTTFRQQGLVVQLGSKITFNPKLSVGQVTEVIEVSEAALSIDPTSSRTATNIDSKTFDALPRSRNFQSLLAMAPGVRIEPKASNASFGGNSSNTSAGAGIQVDGASGAENVFIVDGVDTSNVLNGTLRGGAAVPFEFLSEIQIKSGGFEAEFGGATGGVITAATKSGANVFHGQGLYQFQNSGMNPRSRGFWQGSPANADVADFLAPKEDTYAYHFPGFTLGGPLIKNRVYFYSGYMPELYHTTRTPEYASGRRSFQQDEIRHFMLNRVDYSPFSKVQLNSSWIWSPYKRVGGLPNVDPRRPAPANDLAITGGFQPSQNFNTSGTYSITPNIV
ncbi:MAG: TonB-dependent receptor, partial [Bryobacteraceae bacterium]|nr:TonB-dependent receptor [Bryobacteraceae bacterium]